MPSQLLNALIIVLSNIFFSLFFVVQQHDAFQQCIREFQLTHFLHHHLANIDQELIIAVSNESCCDFFLNLSTEFFFCLHNTFTESLIEQFLIQFTSNKASDFFYLEAEVGFHILSNILVDFQQRTQFRLVSVKSNVRIEYQYIVYFCISEDSFLFVILHIRRHHNRTFYLNAAFFRIAFFVQLSQQTFQHIIILISIYCIVFTGALSIHLHLVVDHLVRYFNRIIIYLILSTYFCLEFRCQSNVEHEIEFIHCIEINILLLFFVRQRFAQHIHLIFFDIIVNSLLQCLIHYLGNYRLAIHLFNKTCRNHTFTESRHIYLLAERSQLFVYFLLIVGFLKLHSKLGAYFVNVL